MRFAPIVWMTLMACGPCGDEPSAEGPEPAPAMEPSPAPSPSALAAPETVTFRAEDGATLAGDFAPGASPSSPVLVLWHQLGRDREEWAPLSAALRRSGWAVLRVDLRGHGASEGGPHGWRELDDAGWAKLPGDGAAALRWLREESGRTPRAIVLGGSSIGSSVALATGASEEVDRVFALSPGRAYRGIDALTPVDAYPAERALLAVAASGEIPSAETARELARIASGGQARVVDGEQHGLAMLDDQPGLLSVLQSFVEGAVRP